MKKLMLMTAVLALGFVAGASDDAAKGASDRPQPENPILPGWLADPQIRRFGDTWWIFPTGSDVVGFDAYSSKDLTNWERHPRILTTNAVSWAKTCMWAPDAQENGGKYYLFFSANDPYPVDLDKGDLTPRREPGLRAYGGIGVAVADRPEGPYRDLIGKPLIDRFWNRAQPIDQYVFKYNDDWYMVYGGWGRCNLVRLASDFKSLRPLPDGSMYREITPEGYMEGSVMFERKGIWYFMYSSGCWMDDTYSVKYATAATPFGPFTNKGEVLKSQPPIATGPGHHSVMCIPGTDEWWICYHRRPIPTKGPAHRVTCLDRMYFEHDGDIRPIVMTGGAGPAAEVKCPLPGEWTLDESTSDEFNGESLDRDKWWDYLPHYVGRMTFFNHGRNVRVKDGCLELWTVEEKDPEKMPYGWLEEGRAPFSAAAVKSRKKVWCGYFECRLKMNTAPVRGAFWLYDPLSDQLWRKYAPGDYSEEIDICEVEGRHQREDEGKPYLVNNMTHHYVTPYYEGVCNKVNVPYGKKNFIDQDLSADFHTYGFYWGKEDLVWYFDGKETYRLKHNNTSYGGFYRPLHVVLDSEIVDWYLSRCLEHPIDRGLLPSVQKVDWVRHWVEVEKK